TNIDGHRRNPDAIGVTDTLLPEQDRVVNAKVAGEFSNVLPIATIHSDSDHLKTFRSILFVHLLEPLHFDPAREPRSRTEVQKDSSAVEIRQVNSLSVNRLQNEVRRRVAP